jgi:hypothetical protein
MRRSANENPSDQGRETETSEEAGGHPAAFLIPGVAIPPHLRQPDPYAVIEESSAAARSMLATQKMVYA